MTAPAQPISLATEGQSPLKPYSFWQDTMQRLWQSPSARIGGVIVVLFVSTSILVPLLDNYNAPRDRNLPARYAEPDCIIGWVRGQFSSAEDGAPSLSEMTCQYPFGADKNGRSIFRRVGHGMATSLVAALASVTLALTLGGLIGLMSGYFSGLIDSFFMRIMDVMLAFPSLLLAIALVSIADTDTRSKYGLQLAMVAVGVTQIPAYARLARSMAISIRNMEYVTAAYSVGANHIAIIRKHILPNSVAPMIVQATLGLGTAVIETAALGFLGLGQQPPYPELGKMLADSQESLASGLWWVMLFPALAIILMVMGFNLLGDGLRDALDPRLRGSE